MRNSKTDILLFPAISAHLQLLFEIDQGCLSVLANRFHIEKRSSYSESCRSEKIQCWSEFPQIRAENCAGADYQIANKIVRANHFAASVSVAISDDERFARRISEFLQPANYERDDERRKTSRHQQTDWEKREHDKGHD